MPKELGNISSESTMRSVILLSVMGGIGVHVTPRAVASRRIADHPTIARRTPAGLEAVG